MIYAEPSWAWSMGNESRQKRWAAGRGAQYEGPRDMWNNSTAFCLAANVRFSKRRSKWPHSQSKDKSLDLSVGSL